MKNEKTVSAKRITALLCAFVLAFTGCFAGCKVSKSKRKDKDKTTTTSTTAESLQYYDGTVEAGATNGVICPSCGMGNVEDALLAGETYDAHFICLDCSCEWYVQDGTAYQIIDEEGHTAPVATQKVIPSQYQPNKPNPNLGTKVNPNNNNNQTKPTTPAKPDNNIKIDPKKAAELVKFLATAEWLKYFKWYIDKDGNITTEGDKGAFGFAYSSQDKCFYAANNAWQRNFGYSNLYDQTSEAIAISYDTIRTYFIYENKEWMIQLWKGQYGFVLLGSEVGVYNRPQGSSASTYFNCVTDDERLPISLTLKNDGKTLFSRKQQPSWWMTGFVFGQLGVGALVTSKYTKKLSQTTTITFKDEQMRKAFVYGLENVKFIFNNSDYPADAANGNKNPGQRAYGFDQGSGTTSTVGRGTYSVSGNSVTLTWQ